MICEPSNSHRASDLHDDSSSLFLNDNGQPTIEHAQVIIFRKHLVTEYFNDVIYLIITSTPFSDF